MNKLEAYFITISTSDYYLDYLKMCFLENVSPDQLPLHRASQCYTYEYDNINGKNINFTLLRKEGLKPWYE